MISYSVIAHGAGGKLEINMTSLMSHLWFCLWQGARLRGWARDYIALVCYLGVALESTVNNHFMLATCVFGFSYRVRYKHASTSVGYKLITPHSGWRNWNWGIEKLSWFLLNQTKKVNLSCVEVMNTDTNTHTWSTVVSLPHPYCKVSATMCGDKLYLLGGVDSKAKTRAFCASLFLDKACRI